MTTSAFEFARRDAFKASKREEELLLVYYSLLARNPKLQSVAFLCEEVDDCVNEAIFEFVAKYSDSTSSPIALLGTGMSGELGDAIREDRATESATHVIKSSTVDFYNLDALLEGLSFDVSSYRMLEEKKEEIAETHKLVFAVLPVTPDRPIMYLLAAQMDVAVVLVEKGKTSCNFLRNLCTTMKNLSGNLVGSCLVERH